LHLATAGIAELPVEVSDAGAVVPLSSYRAVIKEFTVGAVPGAVGVDAPNGA
jgi:hypothetical protein